MSHSNERSANRFSTSSLPPPVSRLVVFMGPTLSVQEAAEVLDAIYLPPAAQGDVVRAALQKPVAMAIIDGYFERIPSVSHKEILFAMKQGIHVFGAASMGALRAAELAQFGMEGVGEVYGAFRRGEIEDDDEVAVAHACADDGYRPQSEAMVNIRATLRQAVVDGVILPDTCEILERLAKDLFYADRNWLMVFARAKCVDVAWSDLDALWGYVMERRVDQKKRDALQLLRTLRDRMEQGLPPKQVPWHFQHTDAWEFIRQRAAVA